MCTFIHCSNSAVSAEMDVKNIHLDYHQRAIPVSQPPEGSSIPGHLDQVYTAQYSSDSGYSSHSDYATPSQLRGLPHSHTEGGLAEPTHHRGMPHSHTEGSIADYNKQRQYTRADSGYHERSAFTESKTVELYGTLPKKGQRTTRTMMPGGSRDAEVYQTYLHKQKQANARQEEMIAAETQYRYPNEINSADAPYKQPPGGQYYIQNNGGFYGQPYDNQGVTGNYQRQTSNNKMSKEEIRQLLISDFLSKGKPRQDDSRNPEHERIQTLLYHKMKGKMGNMSVKDGNKSGPINGQDYVDGPHVAPTDHLHGNQEYTDSYSQDCVRYSECRPLHSRESSSSSTHTLKAHSRENSLSSPTADSSQQSYVSQQQQQQQQQEQYRTYSQSQPQSYPEAQGQPQSYLEAQSQPQSYLGVQGQPQSYHPQANHPNVTDRHIHIPDPHTPLKAFPGDEPQPPKPSVIGKLDKVHRHNLEMFMSHQSRNMATHKGECDTRGQEGMAK